MEQSTNVKNVIVIGGGAAGCLAAIFAARGGCSVALLEEKEKLLSKIYVTGNGRCNLTNRYQAPSCYYTAAGGDPYDCLRGFSTDQLSTFFHELGVLTHERRDGCVYPVTDQADTVATALVKEIGRLNISVRCGVGVRKLRKSGKEFAVTLKDGSLMKAQTVVLSCGGLSGKGFRPETDSYQLAAMMGHTITPLYPALTCLLTDLPGIRAAAGVRCEASIELLDGCDENPEVIRRERGELQITRDAVSGIVVYQLSHPAAQLLANGRKPVLRADLLPGVSWEDFTEEVRSRLSDTDRKTLQELFFGMTSEKLSSWIIRSMGQVEERKASKVDKALLLKLLMSLKSFRIPVIGTGSFEQSQVTAGGIPLGEIAPNMESVCTPGLFIAGEMLDADGICGGYNLTFAFGTGAAAGRAAAGFLMKQ